MNPPPLFSRQSKIVDFCLDRLFLKDEKGAAVFANIGSGKSRALLEIIQRLHALTEIRRTLLVAPLRISQLTWPAEIKKWNSKLSYVHTGDRDYGFDAFDIVLCPPDSLHKVLAAAEAKMFDLVILDESQRFKRWTTKRMKNLRKILPHIPKRIISTGTPSPNSLDELHSQIFVLDEGEALGKNVTVFRQRYATSGGWKGRQWLVKDSARQQILDAVAPMAVYIDMADFADMPKLILNDLKCVLPADAERAHKQMKKELFIALKENDNILAGSAAAAFQKCAQISSGFVYDENKDPKEIHTAKLDALESIVNETGGEPVLVFYQFSATAARIQKHLGKCALLCGGLSEKKAKGEITAWFEGKYKVLLAQVQSASVGLNLQEKKCAHLVFFEIPDSGELYLQGIGRLQRTNGAEHVFAHRLVATGTVDELKCLRLDNKIADQKDFLERLKTWASG